MEYYVTQRSSLDIFDLDEVKTVLRIDHSDEDGRLTDLISGVRAYIEEQVGFALMTQTVVALLSYWPRSSTIELPLPPLQSVTSVIYQPAAGGVPVTVAGTVYGVSTVSVPGLIYLKSGQTWPSVALYRPGVQITFVAGYGNLPSKVPSDLREAARRLLVYWYDTPEAVYVPNDRRASGRPERLPYSIEEIFDGYRRRLGR
jgi:uncharacterized phiE125 gp8 family phage protein